MTKDELERTAATREVLATRTFVLLADTLVVDFDLMELLTVLADRCVTLFDAAAAGILLADHDGRLRVMAASDEQAELLELFQVQSDEGPCLDCYRTGDPVVNSDLRGQTPWPKFSAESIRLGFASVCALPMRLRNDVLGCLNLFMSQAMNLSAADVALAQALADVASIAIMQDAANRNATTRELQLQHALDSRIIIEQAKGMIAEHESVNMNTAFTLIRTFARNHNLALTEAAAELVEGNLSADALTQGSQRRLDR
ncbi:MAG TPA: GAF and ANTAR domain-containing protein [Acidimicrobiales bacterium]|nr:GAF and ANTAR domain-containing protein [Acidimicrobiales bacterium]